ncbi:MAG: recombinase family protein, partial [Tepidiformaceae bacterium]
MIAAIYARKSTEQHGVTDEEKSVTRQIEHARAYAAKRGWTVTEEHIYVDDGVSGVEFKKRPGFNRLMAALYPRPAFQVLVMSEESRLGRDQIETLNALKQIIDAEVRVFVYLDDREVTLGDATQTALVQLRGFAAAAEREQASKRTHDAMLRKAQALHVTGGRVYGYASIDVLGEPDRDGRKKRLYVRREINPEQADVVRRIFQLYANGLGLTKIAKTLNREGIAPPRGDARGWAGTAIREILRRELYRGVVVWDRTQKIVRGGTKKQRIRPEDQWQRIGAPDLRIISEDLWQAVQVRRQKAAEAFPRSRERGRLLGRSGPLDGDSPYLLTGFATCAVCGGAIGGMT